MASSFTASRTSDQARKKFNRDGIMVGSLPNDFLRLSNDQTIEEGSERQINLDQETALALQHQYTNYNGFAANVKGRLVVTVVEAKLVKNYGVTRMDPYVRLRVGHQIYETKTCYNGAKNPRWNRIFHCFLPNGVDTIHIELYDECAFTTDEKIAWAEYKLPSQIFEGETVENWLPLDGKQGDGKEGTICMIISFTPLSGGAFPQATNVIGMQPINFVRQATLPTEMGTANQPTVVISEEEIKQLQEMFPNIDKEVIKSILEDQNGHKERTINTLIQMNSD